MKDTKLNGLSGLNLGGNFETDVNDDLTVGADYDYNECENTPHEVYARWSGNQGGGKVGVLARLNLNKKSTTAELSYSNGDTSLKAKVCALLSSLALPLALSAPSPASLILILSHTCANGTRIVCTSASADRLGELERGRGGLGLAQAQRGRPRPHARAQV